MTDEPLSQCEFEAENLILRLDLCVPGEVSAVSPVVRQIMTVIQETGCAAGKEFEVEVALQEALANAVVHGCKEDPEKQVQISVACDENRGMLVVIRDPGSGFDASDLPSPVEGQQLYRDHGRGVFLINRLMDEVRYEHGGREIWMRKG